MPQRKSKTCTQCQRIYNKKGKICYVCLNKNRREANMSRIYNLLGGAKCWICGYSRSKAALDFHHIDGQTKSMGLSTREMQLSWQTVWTEVQKCCLLCSNCHREHHAGLVDRTDDIIRRAYTNNWNRIILEQSAILTANDA